MPRTAAPLVQLLAVLGAASEAAATEQPSDAPLAHGASVSGLWPRQAVAEASGDVPLLLGADFAFASSSSGSSGRLRRAFGRYEAIISSQKTLWTRSAAPTDALPLNRLEVVVPAEVDLDAYPALGDDESFTLQVGPTTATLHAGSFSGVHRGLETFAQLTIRLGSTVFINSTTTHVQGAPEFAYRGFMLDTGRHFEPTSEIFKLLDGMGASALNVLHWHITDTQAWPWNSTSEPALVRGAYRPDLTYQRSDLEAVVAYAADRAIRVIPEVDMPGHAGSIAIGRPDTVVVCTPDNSAPLYDGSYQSSSQLDPSNPATFALVENLIEELVEIFPDKYVHLGGDEVQVPCYNSSTKIRAFMHSQGWSTDCPKQQARAGVGATEGAHCPGYKHLIAYFLRHAQALAKKHGRTPSGIAIISTPSGIAAALYSCNSFSSRPASECRVAGDI